MRNLFNRTLSILCAVMLLINAVSAWAAAEEEPATPTNLNPAEEEIVVDPAEEEIIPEKSGEEPQPEPVQEPEAEPEQEEPEAEPEQEEPEAESEQDPEEVSEEESTEEDIDSVEVVITKTLIVGQSWEGKMKKTKPAVLKLDISSSGMVYILVEGKDVWATAEKSDRITENPFRTETDPETDQMLLKFQAEEGSYLITLGPVEPNLLAQAKVTVMGQNAYEAWKEEQAEPEAEEKSEEEPEDSTGLIEELELESETEMEAKTEPGTEAEPESKPKDISDEENELESKGQGDEQTDQAPEGESEPGAELESNVPAERYIEVITYDDTPNPVIGDIAHFRATLYGYEELTYTVQWQYSPDGIEWKDLPNETALSMDIAITREINVPYWRIVVYVEEDQES